MNSRCKYIGIIKKPLIRGSQEEIYQIVCRAGEEKVIGNPSNLKLPCQNCLIGEIFLGEHCQFLAAEKGWEGKKDLFSCQLLHRKGFDPKETCSRCNDYVVVR